MQSVKDRLHFGVGYRCLRQYRVYDPKGAIHQGRRPCFATRRWPIPKMEIVQRFSFLVSDKKKKSCNDFSL